MTRATISDTPQARRKKLYGRGPTTVYACRSDPRFSYALYIPPGFDEDPAGHDLLVAIHGTSRIFLSYRDAFSQFGRFNKVVVLAPLFPVGIFGDDNEDGYKLMREREVRYDLLLLEMVAEVEARLGASFGRFMMSGFSGGGQFVNRFLFLHPRRLSAASIGAPGSVTLIDDSRDFWVGTRNLVDLFGLAPDIAAMRDVAVQMIVGAADIETWEINYAPGSHNYMDGINDTGRTRVERNTALKHNFEAHGIAVTQDIVPNAAHDFSKLSGHVEDFFLRVLRSRRG